MRKQIEAKVANMKVVEMRKEATKRGIKNVSKYKRDQLSEMLVTVMVAEEDAKRAKKAKSSRKKATEVKMEDVETLASELLEGIETIDDEELLATNRKVLIQVMKMLHCSRWYRTYDKATMVAKIKEKVA